MTVTPVFPLIAILPLVPTLRVGMHGRTLCVRLLLREGLFKAEGYQWASTGWQSWGRTYAAEGFSLEKLNESSNWMQAAHGVEVRMYDDSDVLLERYLVNDGRLCAFVDKSN